MRQLIDFLFSVILFLRHFSTHWSAQSSGLTQPAQQPSSAGAQCAASWGKVQWACGHSFTYGQNYLHFKILGSPLTPLVRGKSGTSVLTGQGFWLQWLHLRPRSCPGFNPAVLSGFLMLPSAQKLFQSPPQKVKVLKEGRWGTPTGEFPTCWELTVI